MQLEVEQKYRIDDVAALQRLFSQQQISLGEPIRQVDTYFQHPARDFRQTDEAFRLRQVAEANFVTYKGPKIDLQTKTRRELELPLANGSDLFEHYVELFAALGFKVGGTVIKHRRHAQVQSEGQAIEIAWDEVDGLGSFLELETVVDERELASARQAILALASQWGLVQAERRSYLELLQTEQDDA